MQWWLGNSEFLILGGGGSGMMKMSDPRIREPELSSDVLRHARDSPPRDETARPNDGGVNGEFLFGDADR
jgi:hypothetical protein